MAVVECPKGHQYENIIHSACPSCARERMRNQGQGTFAQKPAEKPTSPAGVRQMPKTTSAYSMEVTDPGGQKRQVDPVVGWLVAIEGNAQGRDFPIRIGHNSIGRDRNNRICIEEDGAIARNAHARITFDPVHIKYYFSNGDGSGIVYFRREVDDGKIDIPILQSEELSPWDEIKLTKNTVVVFVPLCYDSENEKYQNFTGHFRWEKKI